LEDTLTNLSTWGYLALAFFSFGGSLIVVAAAGVLSFMGEMNLILSLIIATTSNYIGDMFLFYLGKYHKEDIKPYFEKHRRKIALSTLIMRKYGVWAIFIQKFLYGIKTLVPISMAISRYDFKKFGFYNLLASPFFVGVIMLSAFYAGESIKSLFESFKEYPWVPFLFLFSMVGAIWYAMEYFTRRK
jgi:membrane protein DedA with SNARE-associated domain